MIRTIENITTVIAGEELNPVSVKWDMTIEVEKNEEFEISVEAREVANIQHVRLELFGKESIDVTDYFTGIGCSPSLRARLKEKLLEAVEMETIEELELQNA